MMLDSYNVWTMLMKMVMRLVLMMKVKTRNGD